MIAHFPSLNMFSTIQVMFAAAKPSVNIFSDGLAPLDGVSCRDLVVDGVIAVQVSQGIRVRVVECLHEFLQHIFGSLCVTPVREAFPLRVIRAVFGLTPICGGANGTACMLNLVQWSEIKVILFAL
jgi:hypothetical protein